MKEIAEQIAGFLKNEFDVEEDSDFNYDVNLFDSGYIDSLDATRIILFVEENWSIEITQKDLVMYPMNSINEIAEVVSTKINN